MIIYYKVNHVYIPVDFLRKKYDILQKAAKIQQM